MDERLTSVEDEAVGNEMRGDESARHASVASEAAPKGKAETKGAAAEQSGGEQLMAAPSTGDDTVRATLRDLRLKLAYNESFARGMDGGEHLLSVTRLVMDDLPKAQSATLRELFKELDEAEDPIEYEKKAKEIEEAMHERVKDLRYPEHVRDAAALPGISSRDLRPLSKFYPDIAGYDGMEVAEYLYRAHVDGLNKMVLEGRDGPVDISFAEATRNVFGGMGRSVNGGRTPMANSIVFLRHYELTGIFVGAGETARPLAAGAEAAALEEAEMAAVADAQVGGGSELKGRPVSYTIRLTSKGLEWLLDRKERARIRKASFQKRINEQMEELEKQMKEHGNKAAAPRFGLARRLAVTTVVTAMVVALAALGMKEFSGWVVNDVILLAGPNSALGEGRPLVNL